MAASDYSQANFLVVDPILGVPTPVSVTNTTRQFPLGLTVRAEDQNALGTGTASKYGGVGSVYYLGAAEFVYCQGSNVSSRGMFCQIVSNSAIILSSDNSASFYPIGLAAGALSATNVYGWVQIAGIADYATGSNTDFGVGGRVALASVNGQIGSVTAVGSRIHGIVVISSYANAKSASAPNMTVQLQRPFIIGITQSN